MLSALPTIDEIRFAQDRIRSWLPPTPIWSYPTLSSAVGAEVLVKHENVQPTGAFKVRGGLNLLATMPVAERERGIIAYSTGNHGQSLAYAAAEFGVTCTIVVPDGTNPVKVAAIRARGAHVVSHGADFEAASAHAGELARRHGYRLVGAANEPELIAGVGGLYLEMLTSASRLDLLFVPVGGGSGAAAAGIVAAELAPRCRVVGVQSRASAAAHDSWRTGRCVSRPNMSTVEGVATGSGFELTQRSMREHLADFVLVSDDEIRAAQHLLLTAAHTLAEGAGAVSLAGALASADLVRGKTIGVVCTGGNASESELRTVLAAA
jgi:threonine dehydratase